MNRRHLLQSLGSLSAHAMFPSVLSGFLASCANKETKDFQFEFFTSDELDTIIEVIDILLPATNTQSASQAGTHLFLDQVFARCMTPEQQRVIREGIIQLTSGLASTSDKEKYLSEIDKKAYDNNDDAAYFKPIKQYTLIGFFTSREGTTKASNYVKIPEAYQGEIPATESTLNYGRTNLTFHL